MVLKRLSKYLLARAKFSVYKPDFGRQAGNAPRKISTAKAKEKEIELHELQKIYDEAAPHWLEVNRREINGREVGLFSSRIGRADNVTSIGPGPGFVESFIAGKVAPKGRVFCCDLSFGMSLEGERLKKKLMNKNMQIINASGIHLPLSNGSQDMVFSRNTGLSYTKHWGPVLREARRVLNAANQNARFLFSVDKNFWRGDQTERAALEDNGFKAERISRFKNKLGKPMIFVVAKPK